MMISRSFLRGFGRALGAPSLFFEPYSVRKDPRFDASVAHAWSEVGRYLDDATRAEGAKIGTKTKPRRPDEDRRHKIPA